MKLGFEESQSYYNSGSQNARVWTETWVAKHVFCPNCGNPNINQFPAGRPVADFFCPICQEEYELKSQKNKFSAKVLDGEFHKMCERLEAGNNPSLFLLNYNLETFSVTDLIVVPKHFFVREIIERRKPLSDSARRAGWTGCNILIGKVPEAGRIAIVKGGQIQPKQAVVKRWERTLFLKQQSLAARGWLIEVMKCIDLSGKTEFTIDDIYAFENELAKIYPQNRHVKQKIRQQLQYLRDKGFLEFVSRGYYRKRI